MMRPGWQITGIALVIVLALLGHDSAMAGLAHEVGTRSPVTVDLDRDSGGVHGSESSLHHQEGSPVETGDCGSLQPLLPHASDPGLALPATPAIVGLLQDLTTPAEGVWFEPTWPPGTRRALIQVYRI